MATVGQSDPRLPEALAALRRCGYAVGQSALSAQGHTMVTIAGRMLSQDEIFKLAGMNEDKTAQPKQA